MSIFLENKPRSTLWRLNSNILNNLETKKKLENKIKLYLDLNDNDEVTPAVLWDALKAVLRGGIIAITSHEKKQRKKRIESLENKLKELQKDHINNLNEQTRVQMVKIRKEID